MKFHNGCWLLKEGYGSFSPQQVYEIRKSEYEVQLCAPTRKILKKRRYPGWDQPDDTRHRADAGNDPGEGDPPQGRSKKRAGVCLKPSRTQSS